MFVFCAILDTYLFNKCNISLYPYLINKSSLIEILEDFKVAIIVDILLDSLLHKSCNF